VSKPALVSPRARKSYAAPTRPHTIRELATRWGCHRGTLRRAYRRGDLIAFAPGKRKLLVSVEEIIRVEQRGTV